MMIVRKIKYLFFAAVTVILSLIAADLALHAAASFSPRVNEVMSVIPKYVRDKHLGHRPNPGYPNHDQNGFRNLRVPEKANIVTFGDSHTYGTGVQAVEAWPRVLEASADHTVYNMAFGGWGPLQARLLWDEATRLKPEIVIEGLYSGNDIYDTYRLIYLKGILPNLKTGDKSVMDSILQAEEAGSVRKLYRQARRSDKRNTEFKKLRDSTKDWFSKNSKIYALYWRMKYELLRYKDRAKDDEERWQRAISHAARNPEYFTEFSNDIARTILTPKLRLSGLNLDDPRIREGQRIMFETILEMNQLAARDGIRFIVLLIPTKELVFSEQARELADPSFHELVRSERKFRHELESFLETQSIEYIDVLPALREQLESGRQPYHVSKDGHPNERGHRTIANVVQSYLNAEKQ